MPDLPALIDIKLIKAAGLEFPCLQLFVCLIDHQRRLRDVFLDGCFPRHIPAAFLI